MFVLNYWLREFPLLAIADRFELRCQSKETDTITKSVLVLVGTSFMVCIPGTVLLVKHLMPQLVLQHFCESEQSPSDVQLSLRTDPDGQL